MKLAPKQRFIAGFCLAVAVLGAGRAIAGSSGNTESPETAANAQPSGFCEFRESSPNFSDSPHPIFSVPSYKDAFPDSNSVQMAAAKRWGISPVQDRAEAERRKRDLVYLASSPFYHVDKMGKSIPYVVPRAAVMLQDLGRAYFDSLYIKGIPLHKFIITSATRTRDDVQRLRAHNGNATENSCHLFGTTVDICYNRYMRVQDPDGPAQRTVRDDTLKWILAEVLRDFRSQKRCHVKYEVKQGCFHLTVD